jgi:tetratricopeptide (TPR) repeat protein
LQALQEFKASFDEIGGEKAVLEAQNLPFEDLPLPETEAELPDPAAETTAALDVLSQMGLDPSVAAALDLPETGPGEDGTSPVPSPGDFDLDALLGAIPDDLPELPDLPDIPDIPAEPPPAGETPAEETSSGETMASDEGPAPGVSDMEFDIPNGLLDGLAEDLEQSPADAGEAEAGDLDLDSLGLEAEAGSLDLGDLDLETDAGSLDLGGETESGDLETGEAEAGVAGDLADSNFDAGFTEADLTGEGTDIFDNFNLEGSPAIPDEEEEGVADMDLGDFTLPGIDDMLGGIPGQTPQETGKGKTRKGFFGTPPPEEEAVEEIRLNESDLAQFRRTLESYPLNLRLAVEEIIAEKAVPPAQMANLVRLLVRGASAKETAALAGTILNRAVPVPQGFQKKTGEQLEQEQGSFAYIFVHNFLPIFRLFLFIAVVAASSFYLIWRFVYTPIHAENIYRLGYERIGAGEYERANQRFTQAFNIRRDKKWFYRYAEAFRDQRQYLYAEEKYDELLSYYPRDKKGVLDYAALETYYRRNYEKADLLLRRNILEYNVNDPDALLAQGDNALAWGEVDPDQYEGARFAYARLLERYGWTDPVTERMLKYFIRTDNLKEVLPLQSFFIDNPKKKISAETLAELGGYLLDKRTEEVRGVPNAYVEQISDVRDVLLRAVLQGPGLPEAHYHLSRYYRNISSPQDEQLTLEVALRAFDSAAGESIRRIVYHIEALKRDAEFLINQKQFFTAEEQLVKAIGLYQNGLDRGILNPAPSFGELYATLGDLEYFTKAGDMEMTLSYYLNAEKTGYAPPEMLYRMGSAYYHQKQWGPALERFFTASSRLPLNHRLLLALGNTCYQRQDFFAAQGYYKRLLDLLEAERSRLPVLLPNDRPQYLELAERLMIARNNIGATMEALTKRTGDPRYNAQALNFYSQSAQAWDALTRNPQTMIRSGAGDFSSPGVNLAYLNTRNAIYHQAGYEPQLYLQIDKDVLDPSPWEY